MGRFRAYFAAFQTLCGISAFVVFLILRIYPAAVFGFVAASLNAINSHLNWLHYKGRVNLWYEYNELDQLFWLAFWCSGLGTTFLVYYFVEMMVLQTYTIPLMVSCVWTALVATSGCSVMCSSNKCLKEQRTLQVSVIEA